MTEGLAPVTTLTWVCSPVLAPLERVVSRAGSSGRRYTAVKLSVTKTDAGGAPPELLSRPVVEFIGDLLEVAGRVEREISALGKC